MPAFAIGGSALIGVGSSIFSGIMGKSAAKKQEEGIKRQQAMIQQGRESIRQGQETAKMDATQTAGHYNGRATGWLQSFRERGDTANQSIQDILAGKLNVDDMVQQSSLFKFQQQEGTRGINRQLRARGLYGSGAGLETLAKFEGQLGAQFGQNYMNDLFRMSEQGRQAGGQMSAQDSATGNTLAGILSQNAMNGGLALNNSMMAEGGAMAQQGQARAQGDLAWGQMGQGIGNAIQGGAMQYGQYNMMEPFLSSMTKRNQQQSGSMDEGLEQQALGRGIMAGTQMPPVSAYRPTALAPPINEYTMGALAPQNWASNF